LAISSIFGRGVRFGRSTTGRSTFGWSTFGCVKLPRVASKHRVILSLCGFSLGRVCLGVGILYSWPIFSWVYHSLDLPIFGTYFIFFIFSAASLSPYTAVLGILERFRTYISGEFVAPSRRAIIACNGTHSWSTSNGFVLGMKNLFTESV
jgi:hypothetical protein